MRYLSFTVATTIAIASNPCSQLCQLDGPSICNNGSYPTEDGLSHAYFLEPSGEHCSHNSQTGAACPESLAAVREDAAATLVAAFTSTARAQPSETTTTTQSPRERRDRLNNSVTTATAVFPAQSVADVLGFPEVPMPIQESVLSVDTGHFFPEARVPHLGACPPLSDNVGAGWTSTVFSSRFEDTDVAVKVYPMLNLTHFAQTEVEIYLRLKPLWGICVPAMHYYGTCDSEYGSKFFLIATTLLGETFKSMNVSSIPDDIKLSAVDCMQQIMSIARVTRLDFTLGNVLLTRNGESAQWVDFAFSTMIDHYMGISDPVEQIRMANFMSAKYTKLLWNRLGLPFDEQIPHPLLNKSNILFNDLIQPVAFSSSRMPPITWPALGPLPVLEEEPISWVSPRSVGVGHRNTTRILVLQYGFDFSMFAHHDLANMLKLTALWGDCIPAVVEYGITEKDNKGERKLAIILDFPSEWNLQRQSPTVLNPDQQVNAMTCLERIQAEGLVNGYVRALDVITNSENNSIMWMNFAFGVSHPELYESLDGIDPLMEEEKAKERAYIARAISDVSVHEIY